MDNSKPSPVDEFTPNMDVWDYQLKLEIESSDAHHGLVPPPGSSNYRVPSMEPTTTGPLDAMKSSMSSATIRQLRHAITKIVLGMAGINVNTASIGEEQINLVMSIVASDLSGTNNIISPPPPDGRCTIDNELRWSEVLDIPLGADQVARPNQHHNSVVDSSSSSLLLLPQLKYTKTSHALEQNHLLRPQSRRIHNNGNLSPSGNNKVVVVRKTIKSNSAGVVEKSHCSAFSETASSNGSLTHSSKSARIKGQ